MKVSPIHTLILAFILVGPFYYTLYKIITLIAKIVLTK